MSTSAYMPFYISDYLADTSHLSTVEHGAYLLLLMTYWQTGKPLPDDDKYLANICRMTPYQFKKISNNLKNFFQKIEKKLTHIRMEKELWIYRETSIKSKAKAKLAADKRWEKPDAWSIACSMHNHNHNHNQTITTKEKVEKEKPKIAARGKQIPGDFCVTETHLGLAEKNQWPSPHDEIDAFRDYHMARGTVFRDWDRAFYTWLRNAKKFNKSKFLTNGDKDGSTNPRKTLAEQFWGDFDDKFTLG